MMTEQQLIERLLELQEHPEQITDEQLQQALEDPQMRELVEQLAFTKRAFKDKEQQTENPHIEEEWEKFAAKNFNKENETKHSYPFKKLVASFIGILLMSGIVLAAIKSLTPNPSPKEEGSKYTSVSDTIKGDTTPLSPWRGVGGEAIVFDNIPLEKMLTEIATNYDVKVSFINDDARQLRFHFVWNPQKGIEQVISDLNQFESLSVTFKEKQIIVE